MLENTRLAQKAKLCAVGILAGLLVACGGGGGDGCSSLDPARNPNLPECASSTAAAPPATSAAAALASNTLSLSDASGATITSVSPDKPGTLQALVKNSKGSGVANTAVTFITTDKTGTFVPSSGTALTDPNGVATVSLPAGTQAGAFTVTANAEVSGTPVMRKAGYTVTFPTLASVRYPYRPQSSRLAAQPASV